MWWQEWVLWLTVPTTQLMGTPYEVLTLVAPRGASQSRSSLLKMRFSPMNCIIFFFFRGKGLVNIYTPPFWIMEQFRTRAPSPEFPGPIHTSTGGACSVYMVDVKKYVSGDKACFWVLTSLFFPVSMFVKHRNGELQKSPRCTVFSAVKRTMKQHTCWFYLKKKKKRSIVTHSRTLFSTKRYPQIFLGTASVVTSFLRYRKQNNQCVNSGLTFKRHDEMEPEEPI